MGATQQEILIDYMETGKAVYIEGSDFGFSHQGTDFINYFGSDLESDFTQNIGEMTGAFGSVTESYEFLYSSNPDLNHSVDALSPINNGSVLFYSDGDYIRTIGNVSDSFRTICSTPIMGGFRNTPEVTAADLMGTYLGFLLDLDGSVRGIITDENTSEPIENAVVTVGEFSDTTAANGVYSIDVEPGMYQLTCTHDDYADYTYPENIVVYSNEDSFIYLSLSPLQSVDGNSADQTSLLGSFPNPFFAETNIRYNLKSSENVTISIFNLKGQKVKTILADHQNFGSHVIQWNGRDELNRLLPNGIYFYRLQTGNYAKTKKMMLMR